MNHVILCYAVLLVSCNFNKQNNTVLNNNDTGKISTADTSVKISIAAPADKQPAVKDSLQEQLVAYSKTLVGVSYKFASTNPAEGFDCSGFITHVFNHFNITVPRSSVDFTNYGQPVDSSEAKPGDLILFTGTDSTINVVGHMGIIVSNDKDGLKFIHSTSGKAKGVTISQVNIYYKKRFVKVIGVFSFSDKNKTL